MAVFDNRYAQQQQQQQQHQQQPGSGQRLHFKTPEGVYKLAHDRGGQPPPLMMHYSHQRVPPRVSVAYLDDRPSSGASPSSSSSSTSSLSSATATSSNSSNSGSSSSGGSTGGGGRFPRGLLGSSSGKGGLIGFGIGGGKSSSSSKSGQNGSAASVAAVSSAAAGYGAAAAAGAGDSEATCIVFNLGDSLFFSDASTPERDPVKSIAFTNVNGMSHSFDPTASRTGCGAAAAPGHDLVIGLSSGEVHTASLRQQLQEPGKKLAGGMLYNKDGCITPSRCTTVAWVPNGSGQFLSAHADGNIYVYEKGREANVEVAFPPLKDPAAFSVSPSKGSKSNPIARWHVCNSAVTGLAFSPSGAELAVTTRDGYCRIFDWAKQELESGFRSYYGAFLCCAFSDDGKLVVAGGEDDLIQVWSRERQTVLGWCEGHTSWVMQVSFDPFFWSSLQANPMVPATPLAGGIATNPSPLGATAGITGGAGSSGLSGSGGGGGGGKLRKSASSNSLRKSRSSSSLTSLNSSGSGTPGGGGVGLTGSKKKLKNLDGGADSPAASPSSAVSPLLVSPLPLRQPLPGTYRFGSVGQDTQLLLWDLSMDELMPAPPPRPSPLLTTANSSKKQLLQQRQQQQAKGSIFSIGPSSPPSKQPPSLAVKPSLFQLGGSRPATADPSLASGAAATGGSSASLASGAAGSSTSAAGGKSSRTPLRLFPTSSRASGGDTSAAVATGGASKVGGIEGMSAVSAAAARRSISSVAGAAGTGPAAAAAAAAAAALAAGGTSSSPFFSLATQSSRAGGGGEEGEGEGEGVMPRGQLYPPPSRKQVQRIHPVMAHEVDAEPLFSLAFSPTGVYTLCHDGCLKLWLRPNAAPRTSIIAPVEDDCSVSMTATTPLPLREPVPSSTREGKGMLRNYSFFR